MSNGPEQVDINVQHVPAPNAVPATVVMQRPSGVNVCIIGGMSACEQSVVQVAAAMAASNLTPEEIASRALAIVDAVGKVIGERAKRMEAALGGKTN